MKNYIRIISALILCVLVFSCNKKDEEQNDTAKLKVQFKFDKNAERLDNLGDPIGVADGNAAQSPNMKEVSIHYLELAQNKLTQLGEGEIVYEGDQTTKGGAEAVDFSKVLKAGEGVTFLELDFSKIAPGTYEWVRASLTYQNFDVDCFYQIDENGFQQSGTTPLSLSSFVGFNTYIESHKVKDSLQSVKSNQLQGFWMAEMTINTNLPSPHDKFVWIGKGNAPGTTVVNPNPESPIPPGSCVVTGKFDEPLVITGNETESKILKLSFSINNSFEWKEITKDGKYEPMIGEEVVDMGLRGLHPVIE